LPRNLANFALLQLAAAQLINSMKKVDPDVLILLISEEYDCQSRQTERLHVTKGGCKSRTNQDKALAVMGARDRKPRGACWNCGEKSHHRARCPKPSKNKKGTNNKRFFKKGNNSVNAIDFDLEANRVYAVTYDSDNSNSKNDSIYPQESICNDEDWFSEVVEDDDWLLNTEDEVVAITSSGAEPISHIELYDSGCSTHIIPYYKLL